MNEIIKRGNESTKHLKLKEQYLKLKEKGYHVLFEKRIEQFTIDVVLRKGEKIIPVECGTTTERKIRVLVNKFKIVVLHPFNHKPVIVNSNNIEKILNAYKSVFRQKNDIVTWNISVPKSLDDKVNNLLKHSHYLTKAEFIREVVRNAVDNIKHKKEVEVNE